jgi:hypothetical protein
LELELEHEVPPPNDTSQSPSHFQPSVEPDPEINAAGRAVRKKRLTWKLLQQLPAPPSSVPEPLAAFEGIEPISETPLPSCEVVWRAIKTTFNSFACIASIQTSQVIILTIHSVFMIWLTTARPSMRWSCLPWYQRRSPFKILYPTPRLLMLLPFSLSRIRRSPE